MITLKQEVAGEITLISFSSQVTIEEMAEKFTLFLRAAGYSLEINEALVIINQVEDVVIPKHELRLLQHQELR